MKFFTVFALFGASACASPHSIANVKPTKKNDTAASPPVNWGVVLFPAFAGLDAFGPIEPLWWLALNRKLNLALIAETMDPVWSEPHSPAMNPFNSTFRYSVNPTHTFSAPPKDIDVLLVPGGPGGQLGEVKSHVEFIRNTYPNVKYLISVCTGASIVAQSGILDGRNATTNKKVWDMVTAYGPKVNWKSPARWVVDGNIWSSSGITAGIDLTYAFIEEVYGKEAAWGVQAELEHERLGMCDDRWSEIQGVKPTWECIDTNKV